jgi:hypothetical protein
LLTLSLLLLVDAGATLVAKVDVGELVLAPPAPPTTEVVLEAEVEANVEVAVLLADVIVLVDVLNTDLEKVPVCVPVNPTVPVLELAAAVIVTVAVAVLIPALLAMLIAELGIGAPAN